MQLDSEFKFGLPVAQGDIIGIANWEKLAPMERFGVIVTADCDIQRARPDRRIAYLRIVTQMEYIDLFWAREKLERDRDRFIGDATKMINRLRKLATPNAVELVEFEVEKWAIRSSANDIADSIAPLAEQDRSRLVENLNRVVRLIGLCSVEANEPRIAQYCSYSSKPLSDVIKTASGELSKLRDDLFFIIGFKDHEDTSGYYVLLDQIATVRLDEISDSLSEVRSGAKGVYRFGRLSRQFKYALAQKFAFLFQRIGLPDSYSKAHSQNFASLQNSGGGAA